MKLIYALVLTLCIEAPVMLVVTRSKKWVYYNVLCNLLTNPLLNIVLTIVWRISRDMGVYHTFVAIGEVLVLFGEAALYRAMTGESLKKCGLCSLITNGASFLLGLIII